MRVENLIKNFILIFSVLAVPIFSNDLDNSKDNQKIVENNSFFGNWNWSSSNQEMIISIFSCKNKYCGKILCLKKPNESEDYFRNDIYNPNEILRTRPLIGLMVFENLELIHRGKIYNPFNGELICAHGARLGKYSITIAGFPCGFARNIFLNWERVETTDGFICEKGN